ncbi:MAG: hypothetical protein WBA74_10775, partial [Cyclobacteriaceae bacterium]
RIAKLPYVSLETIYRQKQQDYRQAVDHISHGNINQGFEKLDSIEAIKEHDPIMIKDQLVKDYLQGLKDKKSVLVISPTNAQADEVTASLRQALKDNGLIGKREKSFTVFKNLHLTQAQKKDHRSYQSGQVIQLHQNITGAKRSDKLSVISSEDDKLVAQSQPGTLVDLPYSKANDYDVYRSKEIKLSKGDLIRITKNGFDQNKKRLDNGVILQVKGFTKDKEIIAARPKKGSRTDYTIDPNHGNLDYAYCMTSYGSQGRTVDQVLINQPASTFPATNMKQFYVSVSRARETVKIYTDDKDALLYHASKSGDRQHALEVKPLDQKIIEAQRHKRKDKPIEMDIDKDRNDLDTPNFPYDEPEY